MKKGLKIFAGITITSLAVLIFVPYFFKDKIVATIKETINENVNATVDFNDVDISLISNFPNVKVSLHNFVITTFKPFEGDTLASAKSVSLKMPLSSLFNASSGTIAVTYFSIEESNIKVLINKQGQANYDIAKENNTPEDTNESESGINLSLDGYTISNSNIYYFDEASGMYLKLEDFNHKGSGNLSTAISQLKTETNAKVSFDYDNTKFINQQSVELKATIGVDLNEYKFTFLENEALINQLKLVFDGFVKLNETNQEIDINFKTPSSDFKNFFALIPEEYSKDINGIKTTGEFTVEGFAKGIVDDTHIPQFDIQIASNNASFKYPDLPKTIENIVINTGITNSTGITNDTKVNIKNISFKIDEHTFSASAFISNMIVNPIISAKAKGTLNLKALSQAYPMDEIKNLQGILNVDFETAFDMKSIDQKQYEKTKNAGTIALSEFEYEEKEMANPIKISQAKVTFNTASIDLNNFEAKTGNSDLKMQGSIENLIGFVLKNESIKGNFNLKSTNFVVNDFMVTNTEVPAEETKNETSSEQLKIPSFLDCTINATAATVIYDNLTLKNATGTLTIKDEKVTISNLASDIFNGNIKLNGMVSTKTATPTFSINLDAQQFDIAQSFTQLELFEAIAPIANLVQGKINTKLNVSGDLKEDLTPNLSTLSGNALAELLVSKETLENSTAMKLLGDNLKFIDLNKLDLNNLKVNLDFENGKVAVKPFTVKYKDIAINISGNHGFDQSLDYDLLLNVPVSYLGADASKVIANLSAQDVNTMSIPVNATILGSFTKPTVKTDMKEAVSNLSKQLVNEQKDKAIDKGVNELTKLINNKSTDSTKTKSTTNDLTNTANSLLNGLVKKKKDTTK
jgi:hypothetical protein